MRATWPALLAGDVHLVEICGGDFVSLLQPRVPQRPLPVLTLCFCWPPRRNPCRFSPFVFVGLRECGKVRIFKLNGWFENVLAM